MNSRFRNSQKMLSLSALIVRFRTIVTISPENNRTQFFYEIKRFHSTSRVTLRCAWRQLALSAPCLYMHLVRIKALRLARWSFRGVFLTMVSFCVIFGCSERGGRDVGKSFYRISAVLKHMDEKSQMISKRRRN